MSLFLPLGYFLCCFPSLPLLHLVNSLCPTLCPLEKVNFANLGLGTQPITDHISQLSLQLNNPEEPAPLARRDVSYVL